MLWLMSSNKTSAAAGAVALLAVVVLTAVVLGTTGRHAAAGSGQLRAKVHLWEQAYRMLLDSGARGRTLVVLDAHGDVSERDYRYRSELASGAQLPLRPVDETNIVSSLVRAGVARRALIRLPEDRWKELAPSFGKEWDVFHTRSGIMRRLGGAPITYGSVLTPTDLGGEKVIVLVNERVRARFPTDLIDRYTSPAVADAVLFVGGP
jgi:hypothetical protein